MSNGEVRPPAAQDLELVRNLVEQCLQLHLSKRDAVDLILREANIDPAFTELVWEQLERENREFFEAYHIRLALRQQVQHFNDLLGQQVALMQQITNGAALSPGSNGSHISGNGSHISGNGSHMRGNGYHMPENGSHRQGNGSNGPVNGSHRPANGSNGPVNGSHRPANGSNGPVNGSHRPANGSNGPVNGSHRPANGSNGPVNESHRPANGSNGPVNGSRMPENGYNGLVNRSHWPANGSNGPVNGSHSPADGSNRPVNGFNGPLPVNGFRVPENGSNGPVNGSHRPVNGSNGPVNGSHRPANGSRMPENGSNMQNFVQNGGCYSTDDAGPSIRSQNLHPTMPSITPSAFTNGMSMLQMPTPFDLSAPSRGIDFLNNTLQIQSSDSTGLIQGLSEGIITSERVYPDSQHIFQTNGNVVGTHVTMGSAPFSCVEASSQNESLLATNGSSFGNFGQILQDLSFPDLSTAYPNALANYSNSGFATGDADSFLVSQNGAQLPEEWENIREL